MNRFILPALGITLAVGAACSSDPTERAPAIADGGASSKSGAGGRSSVGKSGSGGNLDAGSAGEPEGGSAGASGSAAGQGGEGGEDEGMIIPVTPSACSETTVWASATPLGGISTAANEELLAITADELDILFLRDAVAMRAHRNLASAAFGTATPLAIADGYDVSAGAALSGDGKTLVLLASTGQSFAAFTRSTRSAEFSSTPDDSAFLGINQRAIQTMQHYAAPVLAPDGKSFVFTAFTPPPAGGFSGGFEGLSVVFESVSSPGGWGSPQSISQDLFDGTTVARPLPSGLASDSRTLFYLDEASGKQMARFRDRPDAPLYTVVDLDTRSRAVPNAQCDRLYYSSGGDVLVAAP